MGLHPRSRHDETRRHLQPEENEHPDGECFGIDCVWSGAGEESGSHLAHDRQNTRHHQTDETGKPSKHAEHHHDKQQQHNSPRGREHRFPISLLLGFGRRKRQPPEPSKVLYEQLALIIGQPNRRQVRLIAGPLRTVQRVKQSLDVGLSFGQLRRIAEGRVGQVCVKLPQNAPCLLRAGEFRSKDDKPLALADRSDV